MTEQLALCEVKPFEGLDEVRARQMNSRLLGALVRCRTSTRGEFTGTFIGIQLGSAKPTYLHPRFDGDVIINTDGGNYYHATYTLFEEFEVLVAERYTCSLCDVWEVPEELQERSDGRLKHRHDCLEGVA